MLWALLMWIPVIAVGCATEDKKATPANNATAPLATGNQNHNADAKPGAPDSTPAAEDTFEGTAGITRKDFPGRGVVTVKEVRAAQNPNYDRVVFEFEGDALPSYHVEYVDKPVRQCGSGEAMRIEGDGWLLVKFTPARAHTDEGKATVTSREQKFGFPILKELEFACDFEAEVAVALGVAAPNKYRVLELQNPSRLVVDIKH